MKTMTCNQLGGACDFTFSANTFEEIAQQSKAHGMAMYEKGDPAHLKAMQSMQELMQSPAEIAKWFEQKRQQFESLPEEA